MQCPGRKVDIPHQRTSYTQLRLTKDASYSEALRLPSWARPFRRISRRPEPLWHRGTGNTLLAF